MYFADYQFNEISQHMASREPDGSFIILLSENSTITPNQVIQKFTEDGIIFFGGIFPKLIYGEEVKDSGMIVTRFKMITKPLVLKKDDDYLDELLSDLNADNQLNGKSAILLTDGLSSNTSYFLDKLFDQFSDTLNYFGGGAGSLTLKPQPCVFSNEGFFQDCAILGIIDQDADLGVRHGWKKVSGPHVVTKAEGNIIYELNWENPLQVYRSHLKEIAGKDITPENFYDVAKGFPFGIFKEGSEDVVRDPITVDEHGHLICVGDIESNAIVNILSGDKESLIESSAQAARDAVKCGAVGSFLVADCISRALFLGDDFQEELVAINKEIRALNLDNIAEGALTLGEISSYGTGYIEFFNKTTVVANFHD